MTNLKEVLDKSYEFGKNFEEQFGEKVCYVLMNKLPYTFATLDWGVEQENEVRDYEEALLFTFELVLFEESLKFYTDVKVYKSKNTFEFGIYFGESEEGTIDLERFSITNESIYSDFLDSLLEFLEHTYETAVKSAKGEI